MAEPRLTPEIELHGLTPHEAFSILGDRKRIDIIRVLWERGAHREYEEIFDDAATLAFSDLQRSVGIRDNGQFNYHLSRLVPHFVRSVEDGYRLSEAGKQIARTVIAIAGDDLPETINQLDAECPVCEGSLSMGYRDQWLTYVCTECTSNFGDSPPDGIVLYGAFPPAGFLTRDPLEVYRTSLYRCMLDLAYLMHGVCRECVGPISSSLEICSDHDETDGQACHHCGTSIAAWGDLRCASCRFAKRLPVELCALGLTPVIAYLYDAEFDVLSPTLEELYTFIDECVETTNSTDPAQSTIELTSDAGSLAVTFDEDLRIVDLVER